MSKRDIIAIGGSLGAVDAVKRLCAGLPADLAAAVAIVVHVGAKGNNLLADIFDRHASIAVSTAIDGDLLQRGHVYVAPADRHLLVLDGKIRLGCGPRENMARPAIDPLFRSVALSFGPRAIGVLLTGLLNDGAAGLADLKRCGGVAVVQNPADALAPDMPIEALRVSDVDYRASIADIAPLLSELLQQDAPEPGPVPADIFLEVDIALGLRAADGDVIRRVGQVVPLSCPACGGVLSELRQAPPLRFRCQVGHSYTLDALSVEKEEAIDEALRVALRIIEERAVLNEKMAEDAQRRGLPRIAADSHTRARDCRRNADTLRRAVLGLSFS
jgi:two-component system chemotaxis response regulator CheB